MTKNTKDVLNDKVHFEICKIGKEYIDKFENGRLDIYEMVAILTLKIFEKGVECMAEYMEQKQWVHK